MEIVARNISEAHYALIRTILNHGEFVTTENGEETVELNEPLTVIITNPYKPPLFIDQTGHTELYYKEYAQQMIFNKDKGGFTYTYGERLRSYIDYESESFDCEYNTIDQLQTIIDMLNKNPTTRRAIMHTWMVERDLYSNAPPCLQTIQCMSRGRKLNMVATFRSNDMLSAWGCNVYGLLKMQSYITHEVNSVLHNGSLTTISTNPHIYHIRDRNIIEDLHKVIPINMERLYGR